MCLYMNTYKNPENIKAEKMSQETISKGANRGGNKRSLHHLTEDWTKGSSLSFGWFDFFFFFFEKNPIKHKTKGVDLVVGEECISRC